MKPLEAFDILVIGGGPGGYVAAIRASQLGFKTALIEKEHLGGVCLNWGCIPTKSLLHSAELNTFLSHADSLGFEINSYSFDIKKIVSRSREVAHQLSSGIKGLLKKNKVTIFEGEASLLSPQTALLKNGEGKTLKANHVILATGAHARLLPNLPSDPRIWTAKEAMTPNKIPSSLVIVGSGAIGIEFASFYQQMGCEVTVLEREESILPQEDKEISTIAKKSFTQKGINFFLKANFKTVIPEEEYLSVLFETEDGTPKEIKTEALLIAVGVSGNVNGLGLEKTAAKVEAGHIIVNEWCETDEPGLYAIGDVAGAPWLAHKASHEGILCVEKIANIRNLKPLNKNNIPGCVYSLPQIASVGLSEEAAQKQGYRLKIGRFPYKANGKAKALGESEGLIKTIFDEKTGELLGAHMIGAGVTELIQGFVIAKTLETTEHDIIHSVFPHPTLSEMMHESVLDAYNRAIHY